jgi:hypothetical protein
MDARRDRGELPFHGIQPSAGAAVLSWLWSSWYRTLSNSSVNQPIPLHPQDRWDTVRELDERRVRTPRGLARPALTSRRQFAVGSPRPIKVRMFPDRKSVSAHRRARASGVILIRLCNDRFVADRTGAKQSSNSHHVHSPAPVLCRRRPSRVSNRKFGSRGCHDGS